MDIAWPIKNLKHKQLIAIPLIAAAIFASAVVLLDIPLTMDFSGGTHISVAKIDNMPSQDKIADIQAALKGSLGGEVEVHQTSSGLDIETSIPDVQENQIKNILNQFGIDGEYSTPKNMGSIITQLYKTQARNAAIGAVVAMAIILFIALRHFATVGGILLVIGLDLLGIFGGMSILGIPLGLASMAGILLLLGYGVNTNILLCTHVLRRVGGTPRERAADAMNTGITMSTTTAVAMLALNVISTAPELEQLSAVLVIGILVDMMNTWLLNSSLVTRYAEKSGGKYHGRI
ncbi:hypothetical protein AKJ43_03195 [candidate division MSBL1 archaeon SCGC-AAA261D19]|uniref:Protein export membrane protein SecD/SecF C-terminal domain-containing protein n=1 Tax=candidate division MSBL1 archaeon SCGC-AAA261D19 TaxID=1698273 RepID=A0A133V5I9_9EURY|nr:hypothetical protein AKJ43_03195 [candidate division MSBL1 archaeon SCGC-AAA261D19]